jgi:hypothetical protein
VIVGAELGLLGRARARGEAAAAVRAAGASAGRREAAAVGDAVEKGRVGLGDDAWGPVRNFVSIFDSVLGHVRDDGDLDSLEDGVELGHGHHPVCAFDSRYVNLSCAREHLNVGAGHCSVSASSDS